MKLHPKTYSNLWKMKNLSRNPRIPDPVKPRTSSTESKTLKSIFNFPLSKLTITIVNLIFFYCVFFLLTSYGLDANSTSRTLILYMKTWSSHKTVTIFIDMIDFNSKNNIIANQCEKIIILKKKTIRNNSSFPLKPMTTINIHCFHILGKWRIFAKSVVGFVSVLMEMSPSILQMALQKTSWS